LLPLWLAALIRIAHALEFEKQFRASSKRKRNTLYLGAIGIMVVTGIAFAIVGTEFREMFPPPGKLSPRVSAAPIRFRPEG
jgi:hypothetical protein